MSATPICVGVIMKAHKVNIEAYQDPCFRDGCLSTTLNKQSQILEIFILGYYTNTKE